MKGLFTTREQCGISALPLPPSYAFVASRKLFADGNPGRKARVCSVSFTLKPIHGAELDELCFDINKVRHAFRVLAVK